MRTDKDFSASVDITIAEPTVTVTPDVAGPRDYITITGENWPVDNLDRARASVVHPSKWTDRECPHLHRVRRRVGRVTQEHRVHRNVSAIPSTCR